MQLILKAQCLKSALSTLMFLIVEDNVLLHTARQLTPAKIGGYVVLRCEMSPQIGLIEVTWLQDGLPLPSGYLGPGKQSCINI